MKSLVTDLHSHRLSVMEKSEEVALTQSNSSKKKKSSNPNINKTNTTNRGVELMLSGGKRKKKPLHIIWNKMICFWNTEIDIYFEFSLSARKKTKK